MKFLCTVEGRERVVQFSDDRSTFSLDGLPVSANVQEVEPGIYSVLVEGRSSEIRVQEGVGGILDVFLNGRHYAVRASDPRSRWAGHRQRGGLEQEGRQHIPAPMPGKVVRVLVTERQKVEAGQGVVVVEAMKMQNEIKSPKSGTVAEVKVEEGAAVTAGQTLVVVE